MESNDKKENILTSWKEIAAYLDRDVRTCIRWEQRYGLPVHRLERDSKAKVFAYKDQIDAWLAERSAAGASRPSVPARTGFPRRTGLIVFGLAALAVAGYFLFVRPSGGRIPADFHIAGSRLIVVDGKGRELWPFDTGLPDLLPEADYRDHAQGKGFSDTYAAIWPYIMIRDIDKDSRPEVLFSTKARSENGEGTLFCFDDRGRERWRFEAGRALEFGGSLFRRQYRIFGFNVDDYDGDKAPEILVISHQKPDWPCQTVLLDPSGRLEGEYWNAGYFMDGAAGDVDGDEAIELVLSGVNNEYRRGCVAVFEAGRLRGCSPQADPAYRSPDLEEGRQSAYILFPKSDVHAAIRLEGDPVNYFWIHPDGDGLTAMTTETQILYDLDRTFACRGVTLSNTFRNLHDKFLRQGEVRSVPDAAYKQRLADAILYYDSEGWMAALARNSLASRPDGGVRTK